MIREDTALSQQTLDWLKGFNCDPQAAKNAVVKAPDAVRQDLLKQALQIDEIASEFKKNELQYPPGRRDTNAIERLFEMHPSVMGVARLPPLKGKTPDNTPSPHILAASNTFSAARRRKTTKTTKKTIVQRRTESFLACYADDDSWEAVPTCRKFTWIYRQGAVLNIMHWVIWQRLVDKSLVAGFGARIDVEVGELINDLGLTKGGGNYRVVNSLLDDLQRTHLDIVRLRKEGDRQILSKLSVILVKQHDIDPETGEGIVRLDPDLIRLFDTDEYKLINWKTIRQLADEALALNLLKYFGTSMANDQRWLIETLWNCFGSYHERHKFVFSLKSAMIRLVDVNEIKGFYLSPYIANSQEKRHILVWTQHLDDAQANEYAKKPGFFYRRTSPQGTSEPQLPQLLPTS